ncbi:HAD family hydrolase [Aspergillus chevalieri]|uniref:Haloacid dehalogenase-like hydrolase n=1 Tax=Aspergillus chevalieri TaxID=182096 RepID=A0A7R7VR53_ASPCH|nr:uncharacterized protein ACHE_50506A [Aspergillus chevalieri]BCR89308.1 hypothetical protein ACHE_50506A [Aspergillus chevalieri]
MSACEKSPALLSENIANDPDLRSVQWTLQLKKYFGFDLDDTLHGFRKASAVASLAVFEAVQQQSDISIETLKATYTEILRSKTASAFTEGKTSTEYRRDRFERLLQAHGLEISDTILEHLLDIYKNSLQAALELKPGALSLLQTLKRLDKKIIVITEGPQDAQEWTVQELGIAPYIDILVTTNEVGKSKVDGLFSIVLEKYDINAGDIVYVGDNEARDVVPARSEGLLSVLYDERGETRLDKIDGLRVESLRKLEDILCT